MYVVITPRFHGVWASAPMVPRISVATPGRRCARPGSVAGAGVPAADGLRQRIAAGILNAAAEADRVAHPRVQVSERHDLDRGAVAADLHLSLVAVGPDQEDGRRIEPG